MTNLVVALQCEARPLVDYFRLRMRSRSDGQSFYLGERHGLVVTGVGKSRAARGCERLLALSGTPARAWLNVGIAGHRDLAIGAGVLASRVIDQASGDAWDLSWRAPVPGVSKIVCTLDAATADYADDMVYDMEASAVCAALDSLSRVPIVLCYKVISDNKISGLGSIDPPMVSALLAQHAESVAIAAAALERRADVFTATKPESAQP